MPPVQDRDDRGDEHESSVLGGRFHHDPLDTEIDLVVGQRRQAPSDR